MPTSMWSWEVVPTHAIAPDGNVRVLFEQRLRAGENKGALLAWCEGKYDPQVRKFHSMALGVTSLGRDHLGVTDSVGNAESEEQQARNKVLEQALKDAQALDGAQPAPVGDAAQDNQAEGNASEDNLIKGDDDDAMQTPSADARPENYLQRGQRMSDQAPAAPSTLRER